MIDIIAEDDGFFPPPWNMYEYTEKTEGWIEFQKELRKNPGFYSYQPERSKREDLCFCEYCEENKSNDKILGFICKQCMQEM
jgi:hypothetical protein